MLLLPHLFKERSTREGKNVSSLDKDRRENQPAQDEPSRALQPGTPAPDFTLQSTPDQAVALSDFRGHPVILAFYPADWSPVCGDQLFLLFEQATYSLGLALQKLRIAAFAERKGWQLIRWHEEPEQREQKVPVHRWISCVDWGAGGLLPMSNGTSIQYGGKALTCASTSDTCAW
jgi:hypothetical protein